MKNKPFNKIVKIFTILVVLLIVINIPNMMCGYGKSLIQKKEYVKAYNILQKAHTIRPNNKFIRYYYVKSMTGLKPINRIQKEVFKFSESKNKDLAQKLAKQQVNTWRNNITMNFGDNYIAQAPYDSSILRWDINSFPLKVKLEIPISTPDYYKNEIKKAFLQWTMKASFLTFEFVEDNKADIIVKFNPLPEDICTDGVCKYVVAYTTPKIKGGILKSMTIVMYDKDANGNYFADKELYNTILHEIGHALGIMGHSYSSDDLMYMSTQQVTSGFTRYKGDLQYISAQDLNTIKLLYKMTPDISNVPISKIKTEELVYSPVVLGNDRTIGNRKIKEAQNYIKSAPNIPGGYIDLAIAYADLEKYPKAVEALRKALELAKTDSEKYMIYYNIATVHLNSNRLDEAEKYVSLARAISDNEELNDLQSNINHAKAAHKKPFKMQINH